MINLYRREKYTSIIIIYVKIYCNKSKRKNRDLYDIKIRQVYREIINATHTKVYASARYRLPENLLRGGSLRCTAPPAAATKRYLRGGKAAQSSMIPSHMFAEHQRHRNACQEDSLVGGGALRGGPAGSWNHASMNPPKEYLLHLQPPRRGASTPTVRESSACDAGQPFVSFFCNS